MFRRKSPLLELKIFLCCIKMQCIRNFILHSFLTAVSRKAHRETLSNTFGCTIQSFIISVAPVLAFMDFLALPGIPIGIAPSELASGGFATLSCTSVLLRCSHPAALPPYRAPSVLASGGSAALSCPSASLRCSPLASNPPRGLGSGLA